MNRKVIVLTPVKNEDWILETFLKTTSVFADHIILADQNSADRTLAIAAAFEKVTVIKNDCERYDEASRQQLLISSARQLFGTGHILLALDADEIISYDSLRSKEWEMIQNAQRGSVLFFEKPTFFNGIDRVIRYKSIGGWPLGCIDDGGEHKARFIHSTRIPFHENAPRVYLNEIRFLHFNLVSLPRQRSKTRYYCMLETIEKTKKWYHQVLCYNRNYDYASEGDGVMDSNASWTTGWLNEGLTFSNRESEKFYWYDEECIKLFVKKGSRKFWMDDVWDIDWEEAKAFFNHPGVRIAPPPKVITVVREGRYHLVRFLFRLRKFSVSVFNNLL